MLTIGIIAEGTTDQVVLKNILKGAITIEKQFIYIRPEPDATDKNRTFGGWQYVKMDCEEEDFIKAFFDKNYYTSADEQRIIIIQLDTAEVENTNTGIQRPPKGNNPDYCQQLRHNVITQITTWLPPQCEPYQQDLYYAICIEEMEAWILTIYQQQDTTKSANPKEKLKREPKITFKEGDRRCYDEISKDFRKLKNLKIYCQYNDSLHLFIESLQPFIIYASSSCFGNERSEFPKQVLLTTLRKVS